jgi:hypothetical protein
MRYDAFADNAVAAATIRLIAINDEQLPLSLASSGSIFCCIIFMK